MGVIKIFNMENLYVLFIIWCFYFFNKILLLFDYTFVLIFQYKVAAHNWKLFIKSEIVSIIYNWHYIYTFTLNFHKTSEY